MNTKITSGEIVKSESLLGFLTIASFVLAIICCNLELFEDYYNSFIFAPISVKLGHWSVDTILINLVNDGVMSFFFLLIGLEMKYHLSVGDYLDKKTLYLPAAAAIGGIIVPASIFIYFNYGQSTMKGWAITVASDTAFMLAILSFFKQYISSKLRAFIIAFSLIDDAFALVILAVFYSSKINYTFLYIMLFICLILAMMNYFNLRKISFYILLGFFLWLSMVQAGLHGTLSGVIVALFIPVKCSNSHVNHYFVDFERKLKEVVNYYIIPFFIFINSGIVLSSFSIDNLLTNLSLGIIFGLFVGKQIGIFGFSYAAIKLKLCSFPADTNILQYYSISILSGIGFTLSFFIGGLAFEVEELDNIIRASIIVGSFISAIFGVIMLKFSIMTKNARSV